MPPQGLSSEQAAELKDIWGANEIPVPTKSKIVLFVEQFQGTMPYILEVCIIISAAVQDWSDFAVLLGMLLINSTLGLHEELQCRKELEKLTSMLVSSVSVCRDGRNIMLPVTELVPGDVSLLVGGNAVPADCEWIEGDILSVDTAALTGEAHPRKYPSIEYGNMILSGSTILAGEAYCMVKSTGQHTEIGQGLEEIAHDRVHVAVRQVESCCLFRNVEFLH